MDELFSRQEILTGLHGSRATRLLFWIENRTVYMVFQARQAIGHFLDDAGPQRSVAGSMKELGSILRDRADLTVETLERYAPHWQNLVPTNPQTRATLIHLFGQKYPLRQQAHPRIRAALGMDEPTVQASYESLYGRPVETLFKPVEAPDLESTASPMADRVEPIRVEQIEAELEWVRLTRGMYLFKQGEIGDSFYILINGRLRSVTRRADDEDEHWSDIGHKDIVGEAALIAGTAYPATVYAIRDSELIKFSRQSLERLAQKHPAFMLQLMQRLARRLQAATSLPVVRSNLKSVAVVPASAEVSLSDFMRRLMGSLEKVAHPLHVTAQMLDHALGTGVAQARKIA